MKKLLMACLSLVMLVGVSGCGSKESATWQDELGEENKIVIGTSADYPPFEYKDDSGNFVGFDMEMAKILGEYLSTEDEKYEVVIQNMTFSTIVSAVQSGQVDLGISGFTYDPKRKVTFSTPYYYSAQMIVVNENNTDIKSAEDLKDPNKKVAAGAGTTGESAANDLGIEIVKPGDYLVMFEMLKNDQLDAVICDAAVAMNYASKDGYKLVEKPLKEEEMSILIKEENTKLAEEINKQIEKFLESDEYTELLKKYELSDDRKK